MMEKIDVKGENCHPIYRWLTMKMLNGVSDAEVTWNFNKFLIDEEGNWVAWYPSKVQPLDEQIVSFASGMKK
jgi:glutathione peroxidase